MRGVKFSSSLHAIASTNDAVKPTWQIEIVSAVYFQLVGIPGGIIIFTSECVVKNELC
jgi:hypothetical protein